MKLSDVQGKAPLKLSDVLRQATEDSTIPQEVLGAIAHEGSFIGKVGVGLLEEAKTAIPTTLRAAPGGLALSLARGLVPPGAIERLQKGLDSGIAELDKYSQVHPAKSTVGQVLGAIAAAPVESVANPSEAYVDIYSSLRKQGVDDETATKAALGVLSVHLAGMAVPLGRSKLLSRTAIGGVTGAVLAATDNLVIRHALAGKYDKLAERYQTTWEEAKQSGIVFGALSALLGWVIHEPEGSSKQKSAKDAFKDLSKEAPDAAASVLAGHAAAAEKAAPTGKARKAFLAQQAAHKKELEATLKEMQPDVKTLFADAKRTGAKAMTVGETDLERMFRPGPPREPPPPPTGPAVRANARIAERQALEARTAAEARAAQDRREAGANTAADDARDAAHQQQVRAQEEALWRTRSAPEVVPQTLPQAQANLRQRMLLSQAMATAGRHTDLKTGLEVPEQPTERPTWANVVTFHRGDVPTKEAVIAKFREHIQRISRSLQDPATRTLDVALGHVKGVSPFYDALIEKLLPTATGIPFRIAPTEMLPEQLKEAFGSAYGAYQHDFATNGGHVWLSAESPTFTWPETVVHEGLHRGLLSRIVVGQEHIRRGIDSPIAHAVQRLVDWQGQMRERISPEEATKFAEPLSDPHEAISWGLTKPAFLKVLDRIRLPSKISGKTALVKRMLDLLAMEDKHTTALAHLIDITSEIMEAPRGREEFQLHAALRAGAHRGAIDPVIYFNSGIPVTKSALKRAFYFSRDLLQKTAVGAEIDRQLTNAVEHTMRMVNPELLGPKAKQAAAIMARQVSLYHQSKAQLRTQSRERESFWNHAGEQEAERFVFGFESGKPFENDILQAAAEGYRNWNERIFQQDQRLGIQYEPRENYLYHLLVPLGKEDLATFMQRQHGIQWGDPRFMKERGFDLYREAIESGLFRAKYWNPEQIMIERQRASNYARMKVEILRDLHSYGLSRLKGKGDKAAPDDFTWRAPNGEVYYVKDEANQLLSNYFSTQQGIFGKDLWEDPSLIGLAYRGYMAIKNTIIPLKLISGFHAIHILGISQADAFTTAAKELTGKGGLAAAGPKMLGAIMMKGLWKNPRDGAQLIRAWRGEVPREQLTEAQNQALVRMAEGGFIPELSREQRTNWRASFKQALEQRSATLVWKAPLALLESVFQHPMFEVWIPSLKAHAYDTATQAALKANPDLEYAPVARMQAFREIQKSVDNRFGEMTYDTTFMNRVVRDAAQAYFLSFGWTYGFFREFGGGAFQALTKTGDLKKNFGKGMLDKALFAASYMAFATLFSGLVHKTMTGDDPKSLKDYIYPAIGKKPDGSYTRVTTPFYTREVGSLYYHTRDFGPGAAVTNYFADKGAGVWSFLDTIATGADPYGNEIRDPDSPLGRQVQQTGLWVLQSEGPIAAQRWDELEPTQRVAAAMGFSPAPQYATDTATQALIKREYHRDHATRTSYDKVLEHADRRELRAAYARGDRETYQKLLDKIVREHNLSYKQLSRLITDLDKDPSEFYFAQLSLAQQRHILEKATPEERVQLLRHAKEALREELQ